MKELAEFDPYFNELSIKMYEDIASDEKSPDWLRILAIKWKQEAMLEEEELYESRQEA